jgi:hypothetical protein
MVKNDLGNVRDAPSCRRSRTRRTPLSRLGAALIAVSTLLTWTAEVDADGDLTLAGVQWQPRGTVEWRLTDGELTAESRDDASGYLVSRETYGDLRLRLEVWVGPDVNSGVFVHCTTAEDVSPTHCIEVNLWDAHPDQQWRTGSLVQVASPLAKVETVGRWSEMEILVEGDRIRVSVNGQVTADRSTDRAPTGHLALQASGSGTLRFRAVQLEAR